MVLTKSAQSDNIMYILEDKMLKNNIEIKRAHPDWSGSMTLFYLALFFQAGGIGLEVINSNNSNSAEIRKNQCVCTFSQQLIQDYRDQLDAGLITYTVFKEKEGEILATPTNELVNQIKQSEYVVIKEQLAKAEESKKQAEDNKTLSRVITYTGIGLGLLAQAKASFTGSKAREK